MTSEHAKNVVSLTEAKGLKYSNLRWLWVKTRLLGLPTENEQTKKLDIVHLAGSTRWTKHRARPSLLSALDLILGGFGVTWSGVLARVMTV